MTTGLGRLLATLIFALPLAVAPALAAGGGGGTQTSTECSGGKVWDGQQNKCVDPEEQSNLDTESIYEAGRALAAAERYGEAIKVLSLAADRGDPRILNYLGYSHRKQGRVTVGLGYYQEALALDPDFTLAREYMGEAYLQLGDVASAEGQLAEIEKRCGKACDEYAELASQIDAFRKDG